MQPIELQIEGFRAYGEAQTIRFNDGLTAITGRNKSGKSSTFLAAMWALYGAPALRAEGITQPECVHEGMSGMLVRLDFAVGNSTYRVSREYKNGTTKLSLVQSNMDDVFLAENLTEPTNGETQAVINRLVGTYEVAAQSWYCGQDADKSFMFATPAERMVTFTELLPSNTDWGAVHKAAKARRDECETLIRHTTGKIDALEEMAGDLGVFDTRVNEAVRSLNKAHKARTDAEHDLEPLRQRHADLRDARKRYDDALSMKRQHDRLIEERKATYGSKIAALDENLAALNNEHAITAANIAFEKSVNEWGMKNAVAKIRDRQIEQWHIAVSIRGAKHDLATFKASDVCPTCERPYDASTSDAVAREVERKQETLASLRTQRNRLIIVDITKPVPEPIDPGPQPVKPESLIRDLQSLKMAEQNSEALTAEVAKARTAYHDALSESEAVEVPSKAGLPTEDDIAIMAQQVVVHERHLAELRRAETEALQAETRATERLDSARKAHDDLSEARAALSTARRDESDWNLIVRGASPRGVPQLVVSQNLGAINSTVNRALDILDPGTQVYLDTQKDRADGAQAETLEATIIGPDGVHPFGTRSGAEKSRIAIAVRVALEVQRAQSLGTGHSATFVIDEAFSSQDEIGKDNFIRFLGWLVNVLGTNVLLVTHDEELKSRFDQAIHIEKVNGEAVVE